MYKRATTYIHRDSLLEVLEDIEASKRNPKLMRRKINYLLREACEFLGFPEKEIRQLIRHGDGILQYHVVWKFLFEHNLHYTLRDFEFSRVLTKERKALNKSKNKAPKYVSVVPLESINKTSYIPGIEFYTPKSAFVFAHNRPYIFTLSHGWYSDDEFLSEQKMTHKDTAILMAASSLSLQTGWFSFQLGDAFLIPLEANGLHITELNHRNINQIKKKIDFYEYINSKTDESKQDRSFNFECRYDMDMEKFKEVTEAIDADDPVLARCLYYFAKSCVLLSHRMFMEEATALQFFCLDGLVKLLMKKHKLQKVDQVKALLMNKYFCPYGDWLKECYDHRTSYVHPLNDIGEYWCPPWDADTCYETIDLTKDLFDIYLLDRWIPRFDFESSAIAASVEKKK